MPFLAYLHHSLELLVKVRTLCKLLVILYAELRVHVVMLCECQFFFQLLRSDLVFQHLHKQLH